MEINSFVVSKLPFVPSRWRTRIPAKVIDFALPQCDRVRLKDFVDRSEGLDSIAFANAALQFLQARYLIDQIERERIPETGPVVIVANHPLGAIDALCLISAIGAVRRDLKIMANQW